MAKIFPGAVQWTPEREAERIVYEACRDQLAPDYTVFYSAKWQWPDRHSRVPRDGEADFVIAHPTYGVLVLEVKGGLISYDPQANRWTSLARGGTLYSIKDPAEQAMRSQHTLLTLLKEVLNTGRLDVTLGYGVVFPAVVEGTPRRLLHLPRVILADQVDLTRFAAWVAGVFAYYQGSAPLQPQAARPVVAELQRLFGQTVQFRPALWGQAATETQQLLTLTQEQHSVLDLLNRRRRAAICGCAGAGKTLLAVEKATRLARQGFRVLLTCYNKQLAADLQVRLAGDPTLAGKALTILHFHELCRTLVRAAGQPLPEPSGPTDHAYYEEVLPNALLDAAAQLGTCYDAILVDEGQDFPNSWWDILEMLLADRDASILYIFYDDNQRLFVRDSHFPIAEPPFPLTRNCRNTQRIHDVVLKFYQGVDRPTALGPPGRRVEVISDFAGPDDLPLRLAALLKQLHHEEKIPLHEIVVLTPFSRRTSLLWRAPATGAILLTDDLTTLAQLPPNTVYCSTIQAFKGLDRSVVVLAELERWNLSWNDLDPLLYVASSRARNHLIVLLSQAAPSALRRLF
ncbi:MAG: ATP-binding domain-containing protein [Chloroflexota bacterium]|nr:ATP-binding domain-containing protein [Chloroflexota bacterium]